MWCGRALLWGRLVRGRLFCHTERNNGSGTTKKGWYRGTWTDTLSFSIYSKPRAQQTSAGWPGLYVCTPLINQQIAHTHSPTRNTFYCTSPAFVPAFRPPLVCSLSLSQPPLTPTPTPTPTLTLTHLEGRGQRVGELGSDSFRHAVEKRPASRQHHVADHLLPRVRIRLLQRPVKSAPKGRKNHCKRKATKMCFLVAGKGITWPEKRERGGEGRQRRASRRTAVALKPP